VVSSAAKITDAHFIKGWLSFTRFKNFLNLEEEAKMISQHANSMADRTVGWVMQGAEPAFLMRGTPRKLRKV